MWLRYVGDTFVVQGEENEQNFLQHINSVDMAIKFMEEDNKEDDAIPFFDTIVKPETDGKLSITEHKKPTHTDQYLQWDSHHHLSAKYSVINTLAHRAKTVCNKPELLQKQMEHLRKALTVSTPNGPWTGWRKGLPSQPVRLCNVANSQGTTGAQPTTNEVKTKGHIVIPYTQCLCKSIKKICSRYGIQNHFKGNSTIKNLLVSPRTSIPWLTKEGHLLVPMCRPYM